MNTTPPTASAPAKERIDLSVVAHASTARLEHGVNPPEDYVGTVTRPDGKVEQWRYGVRLGVIERIDNAEEREAVAA